MEALQPIGRPRLSHIPELDGVRGVAIALILVTHSVLFGNPFHGRFIGSVIHFCHTGVDLFFVLSGFLITCILLDTRGLSGYFTSFFVRRTLRIWPLYFAVLGFVFFVATPIALRSEVRDYPLWRQGWIWNTLFATNLYLVKAGTWACAVTDITWSVCVEEQFYVVWPFVVLILGQRRLVVFSIGMIVCAIAARSWIAFHFADPWFVAYMLPFTRMDSLAVGSLIACTMSPAVAGRGSRGAWHWSSVGTAIGLAFVCCAACTRGKSYVIGGFFGFAAGYGSILYTVLYSGPGPLRTILASAPLRYLGRISYGIYLMHLIAGYALRALLEPRIKNPSMLYGIGTCAMVVVSVGAATVSWRVLEGPVLKLAARCPRPGQSGIRREKRDRTSISAAPVPIAAS